MTVTPGLQQGLPTKTAKIDGINSIFADMELFKWSGAGNTFVVIDGREGSLPSGEAAACGLRTADEIRRLCKDFGTDGLMILTASPAGNDFAMEFYNPDGSSGMMCGNGGRCIVAFADWLGIKPKGEMPDRVGHDGRAGHDVYVFDAPDGAHRAEILREEEMPDCVGHDGRAGRGSKVWTVRLQMKDVEGFDEYPDGLFLNTGTRHFVKFVPDVEAIDIEAEALPIRRDARFAPEGTNVNFVEAGRPIGSGIKIRTFEKGVEGETAACGTGITASAIACRYKGITPNGQVPAESASSRISYRLQAREATLTVDFVQKKKDAFTDVFLTGPAELIGRRSL